MYDILEVLQSSILAANQKPLVLDRSIKKDAAFTNDIHRLANYLLLVGLTRGTWEVLRLCKDFSNECRLSVFENRQLKLKGTLDYFRCIGIRFPKQDQLLQLSYIGRALPTADIEESLPTLIAHSRNLQRKFETDGRLLERAAQFGRTLVSKHHGLLSMDLAMPNLTHGSCVESTRQGFGLAGFLSEFPNRQDYARCAADRASAPMMGPCTIAEEMYASASLAMRDVLIQQLPDDCPKADVTIIQERGAKFRVVTKSPGSLVALAHYIRRPILEILRREQHCADVLRGDRKQAVLNSLFSVERSRRWSPEREILSADLTAASDRLPLDLVNAIWFGILHEINAPDWARKVVKLCVGPQDVSYQEIAASLKKKGVDTSELKDFRSSSGILMGLPLTWITLSICHLFWVSESAQFTGKEQPFSICGDDLTGHWTRPMIARYEKVVTDCGGSFSKGKHYKSPTHGVFTELIFRVSDTVRRRRVVKNVNRIVPCAFPVLQRGVYDDVARSKDLVLLRPQGLHCSTYTTRHYYNWKGFSRAFPLKGLTLLTNTGSSDVPWWHRIGPAASAIIADDERRRVPVTHILQSGGLNPYVWAKERGFTFPTIPRELGGFGLPGRNGRETKCAVVSKRYRRALFGLVFRSNLRYDPKEDITSPWALQGASPARELAAKGVQSTWINVLKGKSYVKHMRQGGKVPPSCVALGMSLKEFYESCVQDEAMQIEYLTGLGKPKQYKLKPWNILKATNKVIASNLSKSRMMLKATRKFTQLTEIYRKRQHARQVFAVPYLSTVRWEGLSNLVDFATARGENLGEEEVKYDHVVTYELPFTLRPSKDFLLSFGRAAGLVLSKNEVKPRPPGTAQQDRGSCAAF